MTVLPYTYVDAPPLSPPEYGILSAASVLPGDPHDGYGFEYTPDFCGPAQTTLAACMKANTGTLSASVGTTRNATLTFTGVPAGAYPLTVNWGDGGATSQISSGTTATHTYTTNGTYAVQVSGSGGYNATVSGVTVANGAASGPFTATPTAWPTKTVTGGAPTTIGNPFVVYSLANCKSLGFPQDRASRNLLAGEGRAVEAYLSPVLVTAATDITGTGPYGVEGALAMLENYIHCNYGGRGTIHMTRAAASILGSLNAVVSGPTQLQTRLGNVISAGCYSTFPTTSDPMGDQWMIATGTVTLKQGTLVEVGEIVDQSTNEMYALAERPYAVAYECFAVKVKITPNKATPAVAGQQSAINAVTGTDVVDGAGGSWTPPAGNLRSVSIVVTSGSVEVDGNSVTAPNTVNFDADTDESLTTPTVSTNSAGDHAVVAWVVIP